MSNSKSRRRRRKNRAMFVTILTFALLGTVLVRVRLEDRARNEHARKPAADGSARQYVYGKRAPCAGRDRRADDRANDRAHAYA